MSGLEVIGSVASVLQLAATVYSISKTLYEVGDALSNAPSDIKDLARDLETFSEELHLLSTLLNDKNGRYSDRVYRLTAKIIGDCATICQKIDRVLKKLKSGSFLSRVKWIYKEKEIMKLLARLRDLKLSLMGTLSLLSALKADTMMDALGVGSSSLLEGTRDEDVSRRTAQDLEDARQRLAGIAMDQKKTATSRITLSSQQSLTSRTSQTTTIPSQSQKGKFASTRSIGTPLPDMSSNTSPFISCLAMPSQDFPMANAWMMNPAAMGSVQSFHTAVSSFEDDHEQLNTSLNTTAVDISEYSVDYPRTMMHNADDQEDINCYPSPIDHIADPPLELNLQMLEEPLPQIEQPLIQEMLGSQSTAQPYENWKDEMIYSAIKHFKMSKEEATSWATSLPVPNSVQWSMSGRKTTKRYFSESKIHAGGAPDFARLPPMPATSAFKRLTVKMDVESSELPEADAKKSSESLQIVDGNYIKHLRVLEDEEVVPGEDTSQMLACNTIWDRSQGCLNINGGEFDLDLLCKELQKKAKSSKTGAVINESEINKIMKSSDLGNRRRLQTTDIENPETPATSGRRRNSGPPVTAISTRSTDYVRNWREAASTTHIPSRLSANSIAEYANPRRSSHRSRTDPEDIVGGDQATEIGTNAIVIPLSPRAYYPHPRRLSLDVQQHRTIAVEEDLGDLPLGVHRSISLEADDREPRPQPQPPQLRLDPSSQKSHSIFTPIDESRSVLSQNWASTTSTAKQAREGMVGSDDSQDEEIITAFARTQSSYPSNRASSLRFRRKCEPCSAFNMLCDGTEPRCDRCFKNGRVCKYQAPQKETESEKLDGSTAFTSISNKIQPIENEGDTLEQREIDERIKELELEGRRERRILAQDEQIRRRPAVSFLPPPPRPTSASPPNDLVIGSPGAGVERSMSTVRRVILEENETRRRLKERDRELKERMAVKEEEAIRQRLRERQMSIRRLSVGHGGRQYQTLSERDVDFQGLEGGAIANYYNPGEFRPEDIQPQPMDETKLHILQDAQMQNMLFEQKNKKSLMMARQEEDTIMQIEMLEEQNKKLENFDAMGNKIIFFNKKAKRLDNMNIRKKKDRMKRRKHGEEVFSDEDDYPTPGAPGRRYSPPPTSTSIEPSSRMLLNHYTPPMEDSLMFSSGFERDDARAPPLFAYHTYPDPADFEPEITSITSQKKPKDFQAASSAYDEKLNIAAKYQQDFGKPTPLMTEVLRRQQRRGRSSTESSASQDESDYRKSATTRTTRSGRGDDENITIKVTSQARIMIGGAQINCTDGEAISIVNTRIRTPELPMNWAAMHHEEDDNLRHTNTASEQLSQLWWRALAKLEESDPMASSRLRQSWQRAKNGMPTNITDDKIASARHTLTCMDIENMENEQSGRDSDCYNTILNSIKRVQDLLKVIHETLEFKVGALVWVCICQTIMDLCGKRDFSLETQRKFAALAYVATIVARYNVMESMYQQWHGMTLETEYEDALVLLCVHVLRFVDEVTASAETDSDELKQLLDKINEADTSCREFSVTFLHNYSTHKIQDLSDGDSDSEGTICTPQLTKRVLEKTTSYI